MTVKYMTRGKASELLDWEIPLLSELKESETRIFDFFDNAAYMRPAECVFKRKMHKEKDGAIWLAKEGVDKRHRSTYVGVLLGLSDLQSEDSDANKMKEIARPGDVIVFIPERSPQVFSAIDRGRIVNERGHSEPRPNDIYLMHMGDIDLLLKLEENYK